MDSGDSPCAKQKFYQFLGTKKLRLTAQRRVIVETVFNTQEHFTAEQLLDWAREKDRSVSRATVYRTLPLLTESGLVKELDFGKGSSLYDPNYAAHPDHNHIICKDCEKIIEFENEQLARLEGEISRELGFSVAAHHTEITGSCDELRRSGVCKNKPAD